MSPPVGSHNKAGLSAASASKIYIYIHTSLSIYNLHICTEEGAGGEITHKPCWFEKAEGKILGYIYKPHGIRSSLFLSFPEQVMFCASLEPLHNIYFIKHLNFWQQRKLIQRHTLLGTLSRAHISTTGMCGLGAQCHIDISMIYSI